MSTSPVGREEFALNRALQRAKENAPHSPIADGASVRENSKIGRQQSGLVVH